MLVVERRERKREERERERRERRERKREKEKSERSCCFIPLGDHSLSKGVTWLLYELCQVSRGAGVWDCVDHCHVRCIRKY